MRKQPRQARARETLAVIVEGGAQVLARRGWAGFNTNEVAEAAGVSIGSIYQYFPNKLALVDAIRRRHLAQVLELFEQASGDSWQIEARVTALIDGLMAAHLRHPGLHRVLLDEAPGPDRGSSDEARIDRAYQERCRALVATATGLRGAARLELAGAAIGAAIEGMVHEAARREGEAARRFRDEIVRFVVAYLERTKADAPERAATRRRY